MSWCERRPSPPCWRCCGALAADGLREHGHPSALRQPQQHVAGRTAVDRGRPDPRSARALSRATRCRRISTAPAPDVAPKYILKVMPSQRVADRAHRYRHAACAGRVGDHRGDLYADADRRHASRFSTGTVTSAADYDRSEQRFADIRAARDAEIRDAHTVADQITQQIAAKRRDGPRTNDGRDQEPRGGSVSGARCRPAFRRSWCSAPTADS